MNAGDILSTCSLVVENIFKYIETTDLENCAKVCNLWEKEAEAELNRRDIIFQLMRGIPFGKMVKEITEEVTKVPHDWQKGALDILHKRAEDYMRQTYDDALMSAQYDGREKVSLRDIRLSHRIRGWSLEFFSAR